MSIWNSIQGRWVLNDHAGNGNWLDTSTTNNNTLVGTGTPAAGHSGINSAAVTLNGSAQILSISDASQIGLGITSADFTVAAWINITSDGAMSPTVERTIYGKDSSNPNLGWALFYTTPANGYAIRWYHSNSGTSFNVNLQGTNSVGLDTWHHYAVTYDHSHIRMYVDGTSANVPFSHSGNIHSNTEPFRVNVSGLGNRSPGHQVLDDIGVWTRCLSSSEIQSLFALGSNFGDVTGPIVAQFSTALTLDLSASPTLSKIINFSTTLAASLSATPKLSTILADFNTTLTAGLQATPTLIQFLDFNAALSLDVQQNLTATTLLAQFSTALTLDLSASPTVLSSIQVLLDVSGSGKLLITDILSLGAGGSFTSSGFLTDQFIGLSGYLQSNSSNANILLLHSVNSAFTSAVTETIVVGGLGEAFDFDSQSLPGKYMKYAVDPVNSSTQLEVNIFGNL